MSKAARPRRPETAPALQYLALVRERFAAIRRDLPAIIDMAARMAQPLLAGGNLFTPSVSTFWPHEFGHRAGGLMAVQSYTYVPRSRKDVAYFVLPDRRSWDPAADATFQALLRSKAQLFAIGREDDLAALPSTARIAAFTGGVGPEEGLYAYEQFRPLAPLRNFETFVRGWITTGEMITACIRAGKMPSLWMSVWLEGALVRNAAFMRHDNIVEPWYNPMFHEPRYIPPLDPGYAASEFLAAMEAIHARLEQQAPVLATAGQWLAEAKQAHKRIWTVLVGHSYPMILNLAVEKRKKGEPPREPRQDADYPLDWGWSISDLAKAFPKSVGEGDVGLHLGYGPVNVAGVEALMKRGIRLIHTTPYGRPPHYDLPEGMLWFDLPWRPADATVDIPGYSVRMLPGSSTAETMAYNAILCELAARMGWQ